MLLLLFRRPCESMKEVWHLAACHWHQPLKVSKRATCPKLHPQPQTALAGICPTLWQNRSECGDIHFATRTAIEAYTLRLLPPLCDHNMQIINNHPVLYEYVYMTYDASDSLNTLHLAVSSILDAMSQIHIMPHCFITVINSCCWPNCVSSMPELIYIIIFIIGYFRNWI